MRAASLFWSSVLAVALIIALVYVFYKIRRTTEESRQRSDERAAAMLIAVHKDAIQRSTPPSAAPALAAANAAPPSAPQQSASVLVRRPRLLTDAQRIAFLVLRAAMPEYFIMAHVRLVDLIEHPEPNADIESARRLQELARERLDFVICNNELVPVAAVVVYDVGIGNVPDERIKAGALRELGVRFLRLRADSLPRPAETRSLVLG